MLSQLYKRKPVILPVFTTLAQAMECTGSNGSSDSSEVNRGYLALLLDLANRSRFINNIGEPLEKNFQADSTSLIRVILSQSKKDKSSKKR